MTGGRCPIRLGAACSVLVLFFVATSGPCIFHSSARAAELLTYELDTGDRIRVTVFGHEDLSGEFEIDGSGRVSLPLISQIKSSGPTLREIKRYNPHKNGGRAAMCLSARTVEATEIRFGAIGVHDHRDHYGLRLAGRIRI